ncbi:hypothetical protein QFZ22_004994 [Streptomyces canus]|uniref:Uncharacterized protein n=1 Tax=Streptomyces canus TaxID=58343 RepID=A0AAW8FGY2_9ACTN|nr:hypothetical protein [Streptomyces canus]MDQ0909009.1 hypothetical protein [Streptomyces canus]
MFLLAHQMPWLGMLLSTVITVGLKPRFRQLGRMSRKVWLTLHIGVGVGRLGVSLTAPRPVCRRRDHGRP